MRIRECPVLADEDRELVDRLALGMGEEAARVLGYLLLREREPAFADDPATRLEIRIGTNGSRSAVSEALTRLTKRDLITETAVQRSSPGRPPKAWRPRNGVRKTLRRVDDTHAVELLSQAVDVTDGMQRETIPKPASLDATLTVGLNWQPNVFHAPLLAAVETEQYQERGLTVTVPSFEGSGRALDALLAAEVDVVLAGAATTVQAQAAGAPLVSLAPVFQRAMTVLYTTRDVFGERFHSIEQISGRRIGMPDDSETGLLGRLFLSQSGLLESATIVDVDGEERAVLQSGHADVVTGMFTDPRVVADETRIADVLSIADHFPVYGPVLVTTEKIVSERPQVLVAFLAGTLAGRETMITDPKHAMRTIGRTTPDAIERGVRDWTDAVERFETSNAVRDHGWGWQRTAEWQRLETALDQANLLCVA